MTWLPLLSALGLPAGFLLIGRVPRLPHAKLDTGVQVSVIIPARNEEENLPQLLESIATSCHVPNEVIVVDDASIDLTAEVSRERGARVISSEGLPHGWTGKTWACHRGARAAKSDLFLFLDADTRFEPGGFENFIAFYQMQDDHDVALSVLPFHTTEKLYEELSLFFNLLMAMGAGGFGVLSKPRLFGQSLLIARKIYERSGGHSIVRRHILENLALSPYVCAAGSRCCSLGGRGILNIRMFPGGFAQLCEGWGKAFADGAATTQPGILAVAVFWIAAAFSSFLFLFLPFHPFYLRLPLYFCFVLQLSYFSRQIGSYRRITCIFYPVPLIFYLAVFGQSFYRRLFRHPVRWRGREI